mmetsp:Transcript_14976/g.32625  ORF Transcript_14976/g.32625 Transcript_14976/m.32625 type:complete len:231 (+) Transcript_14976:80-772(+)
MWKKKEKKEKAESTRTRTVGASCLTWLAIVLSSLAFFLAIATIVSCKYVVHEANPEVADAEMATAGIFCYDSSFLDSYANLGTGGVRIFVQVVACVAAVLGLVMVIMLWKTTRKVHGKCYHRTMGFFVLTCFMCMFLTLILQTSDFCLDYEGLSHNCDLGWGGYAAIASGCLYFLAGICLCKMPKPKEHPAENEEDEPDMIVTKEDDKKDEKEKDEEDGDDEEASVEKAQ